MDAVRSPGGAAEWLVPLDEPGELCQHGHSAASAPGPSRRLDVHDAKDDAHVERVAAASSDPAADAVDDAGDVWGIHAEFRDGPRRLLDHVQCCWDRHPGVRHRMGPATQIVGQGPTRPVGYNIARHP